MLRAKRLILAVLLLVFIAGGAIYLLRPSHPAQVMVLRRPYRTPVSLRDRLDSWIPSKNSWEWAWQLENLAFGKRRPANFFAELISLPGSSNASLSHLSLSAPLFTNSSLQVWLPDGEELRKLREHLRQTEGARVLFRPRIVTVHGVGARLFQGDSILLQGTNHQVGLTLNCFARVKPHSTDVFTDMVYSELATNLAPPQMPVDCIQTNFDAAVRLQVPKGSGIFLLEVRPVGSDRQRIAVLIDPPNP